MTTPVLHAPFLRVPSLLTTAAALAVAVVLAVAGAGGTYALWSTQRSVPGGVITTGSAALAVTGATTMSMGQLYPGQTSSGELVVTNTGTVPLRLRVDALSSPAATAGSPDQALAAALTMRLWASTGTGCTTLPVTPAWTGKAGAAPGELGLVLNPGAAQSLCSALTLDPDTPSTAQGATTSVTLVLGGVQQ